MKTATDIIVKTGNPAALDRTLQSFGAAVVQENVNEFHENAPYMKKEQQDQGGGSNQQRRNAMNELPAV